MDRTTTNDLYDCANDFLRPLFQTTYPWEILHNIKSFIKDFINSGAPGFNKYSEGVFVGLNVKIAPLATIEPPALIGSNTEIRPGAYIRGNVIIGENCVIGNSSELKHSILLNNVQVPHYNYVGDSILGNFSHMGAGSICSNLKADKTNIIIHGEQNYTTDLRKVGAFLADYADIGCNCVLNPGTVIGKHTSVYPLTPIRGVIPEQSIVKNQNTIVPKLDK